MSRADQIKRAMPKRQHWVPCFYLRYFATQETRTSRQPKAWVLSKREGDPMLTSIRNVAHQRYLYSPRDEAGKLLWDLESKFADYEGLINRCGSVLPMTWSISTNPPCAGGLRCSFRSCICATPAV